MKKVETNNRNTKQEDSEKRQIEGTPTVTKKKSQITKLDDTEIKNDATKPEMRINLEKVDGPDNSHLMGVQTRKPEERFKSLSPKRKGKVNLNDSRGFVDTNGSFSRASGANVKAVDQKSQSSSITKKGKGGKKDKAKETGGNGFKKGME